MLKLEDRVTSFELSFRLKNLGVKQESWFVWFKHQEKTEWSLSEFWQIDEERFDIISAFMSSELGELFKPIKSFITEYFDDQIILYENQDDDTKCDEEWGRDATETNARARMFVFLLENGVINS